uniref:RHS repeat-associated core domain-containing protein n=1 Tax=Chitinivorax sp. B TaxID=2502235 RepID=UPI0010FA176B
WQQFDAWGNRLNGQGDIPQYGYTGREPDVAGLIYYRARWYDPSIGRFTQRDPSGLAGGLNPYGYVDGDPINLIDPSGLTSAKPQPVRQTSYVNSPLAVQPGKQMLTSMMANFEARQAQDSQAALDRAQNAADHWVQKQQETGNPLYAIPGIAASALANPDTMDKLGLILSVKGVRAGEAGRFSSLHARRVAGDNLTPHHMPQAAAGRTSYEEGGALVMTHAEHVVTRTWGSRGRQTVQADANLPFRDVLAKDIRDVRSIVGKKYNEGLKALTNYYRDTFPKLMNK